MSDDEIWSRWKFPADWSWKQSVINLARVIEREARRQALEDASSAVRELLDDEWIGTPEHDALACAFYAIRAIKEETK